MQRKIKPYYEHEDESEIKIWFMLQIYTALMVVQEEGNFICNT
jgi:hypothetical protein